jgi:hypothetical protein
VTNTSVATVEVASQEVCELRQFWTFDEADIPPRGPVGRSEHPQTNEPLRPWNGGEQCLQQAVLEVVARVTEVLILHLLLRMASLTQLYRRSCCEQEASGQVVSGLQSVQDTSRLERSPDHSLASREVG